MKRKLAIILSTTMILTSALTGCTKDSGDEGSSSSSSKGGKYKKAEDLIEAYTKEDHDNMKMNMDIGVNAVISSDGTEFKIPATLKGDMEVAKEASHGNMEMSVEFMGESQEMSYEMYTVKDGKDTVVYTCDKETDEWTKSSSDGVSIDVSALNEILENDAFKDADLSYKKGEYTMTVSIEELLESKDIKDKISDLSDSVSSLGIDEDTVNDMIKSAADSEMVYVFDDDLNMTKFTIKEMKLETSMDQDGYSMDIEVELNATVECSDFGKVDEDDVKVPDEVVDEASESSSESFDDILDAGDADDADDESDDDDDYIVNDDVDRSDFKAKEDVLGSIDGKTLSVDSKWDDTFGKAGFEFDSDEEEYTISASSDDYESVYLYINGPDWDEEIVKAEDIKKDGMGGYSIDVSCAEDKPEMTWNGLTWGASAEDIVKAYGEPDYKYEGSMYDSYEYSTLPDMDSTIEFYVYHDDLYDQGLQKVDVLFEYN